MALDRNDITSIVVSDSRNHGVSVESVFQTSNVLPPTLSGDDMLIDRFIYTRGGRKLSQNTIDAYLRDISTFRGWLREYVISRGANLREGEEVPLRLVNGIAMEDYVKYVRETYEGGTVRRLLQTVRSLYKYGMQLGYFQVNPTMLVDVDQNPQARSDFEQVRILTRHEIRDLFTAAKGNDTHQLIMLLLLTTGARVGELARAQWKDIRSQQERVDDGLETFLYLHILGKGNKWRKVKLLPRVWDALKRDRIRRGLPTELNPEDESPLVISRRNRAYTPDGISKFIAELGEKAKIGKDISAHWFRHTCASLALLGGATLQQVKEQLGHSSLRITEIYLHSVAGLKDTASDHLSGDVLADCVNLMN